MIRTHTCRRVAELLSQSLDEPLGLFDTIRLRVHLAICGNCRHVGEQLKGVQSLTATFFKTDTALEDDAKEPMAHGEGERAPSDRPR